MLDHNAPNYQQSADFLTAEVGFAPTIGIVLGSGLGAFADSLTDARVIPYEKIPGFVKSTVPGHKGQMVVGKSGDKHVICMQGRFHYYEGYSMDEVTFPIRAFERLGVKKLILTNAAGCINTNFNVGEFMLISDHINFLGNNPLIGPNKNQFGPRFPDMSRAYDSEMRNAVRDAATELNIPLREGVYIACTGPSYETPAEIRAFRLLGADAVGMSTVPEAIVANHCGIKVCAVSCLSNMAAGILDNTLDENDVIEMADKSGEMFVKLIHAAVGKM